MRLGLSSKTLIDGNWEQEESVECGQVKMDGFKKGGVNCRFRQRFGMNGISSFWNEKAILWTGEKKTALLRLGWDENEQVLKAFMADGLWRISIIKKVHLFIWVLVKNKNVTFHNIPLKI